MWSRGPASTYDFSSVVEKSAEVWQEFSNNNDFCDRESDTCDFPAKCLTAETDILMAVGE